MCAFLSPGRKNGSAPSSVSPVRSKNGSSIISKDRLASLALISSDSRMVRILEMIQAEPLCRATDLARELNLSHSYLEHLFKKETGVPLGQMLTKHRLLHAAHLLSRTNMRIKEIAQTIGYEHTSSFVRAFERHFSAPPRLYRRESAKRPNETSAERRVG